MMDDAPLQMVPPPPAHLVDRWISDAHTLSETTLVQSSSRCDFCSTSGYPCISSPTSHATTDNLPNLPSNLPSRAQSNEQIKAEKRAAFSTQDTLCTRILEIGKRILKVIGDCVFWILLIIPIVLVVLYQCYESLVQNYKYHKQHRPKRNAYGTRAKPDATRVNVLVRLLRKIGILKIPKPPNQIETEPACMTRFCERCTPSEDLPWPDMLPPAYSP